MQLTVILKPFHFANIWTFSTQQDKRVDNDEPECAASPAVSRHFTAETSSDKNTMRSISGHTQLQGLLAPLTESPGGDGHPVSQVTRHGAPHGHVITKHHVSVPCQH